MNKLQTKFFLTKKKEKIRYQFNKGKNPLAVVFLHGLMSDLTGAKVKKIRQICKQSNISFLAFEYTGHGKSSGTFTDFGIADWIIQSKEIIEKVIKTKKIIIIGSSMGSWIGSYLIKKVKKKIVGFIGIASAPDFTKEIMWKNFSRKVKKLIRSGQIYKMPSSYNNFYPITLKLIESGNQSLILDKKIQCNFPIRLLHGLKDKTVNEKFSIKLAKVLISKDTQIFFQNNGDHSLSTKQDLSLIATQLLRLFKNTL